ncbi:hypothetical protein EVAR_69837_1 [Eumeta japonica]|uniref:Uncharacterized protein n=1 Tax=Eumeta variegata TaxID=151549 RepID=A0A4C1ZYA3_EUMVA|nr:hypothetical protein EVAR_69837_1 [Eumeta japonica]
MKGSGKIIVFMDFIHSEIRIGEGIPELDVPGIEPLSLGQIALARGPQGAKLTAVVNDVKVRGPSNFVIQELKTDDRQRRKGLEWRPQNGWSTCKWTDDLVKVAATVDRRWPEIVRRGNLKERSMFNSSRPTAETELNRTRE